MEQALKWVTIVALCCSAGAAAGDERLDARLQEAQTASDEETELCEACRFAGANPRGEHARALREAVRGGMHPTVACSLDEGVLHLLQGDFARAEPLLERALAIQEAALGKNHPDVAASLNHLSNLYTAQGLYARAEPLFQRALAIRPVAPGKAHPGVAGLLNNLASLYYSQGLYARAEPLYARALALEEVALGKAHPSVADSLDNLALLYKNQGLYKRAEPLLERALAIREAALGKMHADVAASLNNLANLYKEQGSYARAEELYARALAVEEVALGKTHPDFGISFESLANLYRAHELYTRAEPIFQRALAMREAASGKSHPDVASSLNNLALLRLAQHRLTDALPLFTRAFGIFEQHLRQESLNSTEEELDRFLQKLRGDEEPLYLLLSAHPDDPRVRNLALSTALLLKGRSVAEIADTSRAVYRSLSVEDRGLFERLRGLRTQIATLSLDGPGSRMAADYERRLKELTNQGKALEAGLARRSAPLRALSALPAPDVIVGRVAASLPPGSALVEFIAYMDTSATLPQLHYLALVLFPGGSTRALALGPAEPIDSAATRLHDALANRDFNIQVPAQALYRLVFQPLLPLLGDTRRLFLSPDGQLGLVPFAALHDGRSFLIDAFDFTYLTSGRDLLPRPQGRPPARSVVVLADPDFSASLPAPSPLASASARVERSTAVEHFFSMVRSDVAERPWTPLPGTRQEAEAIQRLVPQAQLFLGTEASKERLMHLPTPGVLHLATHGFFLADVPSPKGSRAVGYFGALGDDPFTRRLPDPLLRSGLVLAGARPPASGASGSARSSPESALVTALELAGLDLWGTELVVLSACDTGRGDVRLGQGVYGLRRAFVAAGAETVVMSLWKVNDWTTSVLMEAYYRNLLEGHGRATALSEAMRSLRATRLHPHYWAPFIALGQDAPLRALAPSFQKPSVDSWKLDAERASRLVDLGLVAAYPLLE